MPGRAADAPNVRARRKRWLWIGGVVLLGLVVGVLAVAGWLAPVGSWITAFRGWIDGFGAWGAAVFALVYVIATLAMAPCAPLALVAGLAWGLWALPLVLAAALAGASLAFEIARRLAQDRVLGWACERPRGAVVVDAVNEQGWKIVLLLRLSPVIPFNVQNYLFGVSGIGFIPYFVATALGVLPGAVLFISLGALGHDLEGAGSRTLNWILFGVGLVATALVAVLVTRKVLVKLRDLEAARGGNAVRPRHAGTAR
jgi:uncharacterized membrane protein YdjX (TVP38/TMEM64 family)